MTDFKIGDRVTIIGGNGAINIPDDEGPVFTIESLPDEPDGDYGLSGDWVSGAREMQLAPIRGVDLIASERQRQVEVEGFTAERDAQYAAGELVRAAEAYVWAARMAEAGSPVMDGVCYRDWPWDASWWKPSDDPIRNLAKAGALISAEIDRLAALDAALYAEAIADAIEVNRP